jgi:molecular chaperone GrpE
MTEKKKEKHKEQEEPQPTADDLAEFYGFLDSLLPHSSKLLRETFEKHKETLEQNKSKKTHEANALLEFEKTKNGCLQELLAVAVDQFQRVGADYINFQKRVPKQISDTITYEKELIIKSLLPALDNFEHTVQKAESAIKADILKGIQMIYDQMLDILKSFGVEQIKALGEKFDPSLHEAMLQKAEPEKEDNLVLEEFQKGYRLNGRVIRPSRVIVNKLPVEEFGEAEQGSDLQKQTKIDDETIDTQ